MMMGRVAVARRPIGAPHRPARTRTRTHMRSITDTRARPHIHIHAHSQILITLTPALAVDRCCSSLAPTLLPRSLSLRLLAPSLLTLP